MYQEPHHRFQVAKTHGERLASNSVEELDLPPSVVPREELCALVPPIEEPTKQKDVQVTENPFVPDEEVQSYSVFLHERATAQPAERRDSVKAGGCCGGCCQQLSSTMYRVLLLMSRNWCSTLCEFFIPILFVIGTVALWAIFGTEEGAQRDYFNTTGLTAFSVAMGGLRAGMCINETIGPAVTGMAACNNTLPSLYYCPEGRGIPTGFCYPAILRPLVFGGPSHGITSVLKTHTAVAPSFDDMVALHWCNFDESTASFGSVLSMGGRLLFAPDTAETMGVVEYFRANSVFFDQVYGGTFETVADASKYVEKTTNADAPIWGVIQVGSLTVDSFDVTIRLNGSALPSTTSALNDWYIGGLTEKGNELYLLSGFLTLQTMMYDYYFTNVLGITEPTAALTFTPMPTPKYKSYLFVANGGQLAPLILVLGFLYPVSQLTKRIVVEKELRIREAMLIMGLSEVIMYLAWLIIYAVWYIVVALIIAIIARFTYLPNSSFGYMFFLILFFAYSLIFLSGLIASLFSKARLAALLSPLIYFVMAIPLFAMNNAGGAAKTGVLFLSPSALAVGLQLLFKHESTDGAGSGDLTYIGDEPQFLTIFIMFFVDMLIYFFLMVYLELVVPKDWGTTKHPLFCIIDPIKWCCCRHARGRGHDDDDYLEDGRAADGVFETTANDAGAAVRVEGLRKKFKRGGKSFLAVNNLYWSLREGEISVLLGHNGAGKSTTMNLMTGMLAPDAGDCIIYNKSVRHQLRDARQEIGLCPQHNILWPELTVREHLEYYAAIKGRVGAEREQAVQDLLEAIDFTDKVHYMSKGLSGGQKRKLSVAVAFVGGSRLVFLDEPTAGMDVGARRHTWGLLKEMAKRHTILLTTHFMDEADLLGSTVAIMSQGQLQCSGSSMFLKSRLGVGFVLTMSVVAHVERGPIEEVVRGHVPGAEPASSGAGELSYRLPMEAKGTFPALLTAVEDGIPKLGISAYSLSATTLEEVFLRIAEGDQTEEKRSAVDSNTTSAVWNVALMDEGWGLRFTQFRAMIIKRFWNALRDHRTQFFQIVCPVLCVLLAMLLMLVKFWQHPALTLSSSVYTDTVDIPVAACDTYFNLSHPISPNADTVVWDDISDGAAFSSKLLSTILTQKMGRYGGILCCGVSVGAAAHSGLFYNTTGVHEIAVGTANYYGARLQRLRGGTAPTMITQVEGLPPTEQQKEVGDSLYAMMIAVIIMIPFSFIPSTFVGWVVKEQECKARHLQNVSGLSFYVYWVSNFVFDFACYVITIFLVIAVFGIFQREEYIASENIGATIVLFLLYGISGIWMAYAASFFFTDHSTAQSIVMLLNFIVGFLLVLGIGALQMISSTQKVAKVLRWIFRIVPSYCVGEGISNLSQLPALKAFGLDKSAWSMNEGIGWVCVYMGIEIPVLVFITLFIDHPGRRQRSQRLLHNPDAAPEEVEDADSDVTREREEVENSAERQSDLVRVRALRKQYANGKVAVRNVTFGVKPGEVFGFLGTNGAGKTTTISILCQEFYPISGHASICGYDIVKDSTKALRCIGYCPQFDACIDLLTVEEHLYLYAGVRGITAATRAAVVEGLMSLCELTNYRKTKSHELSGGNRRKLSVAVSLIGGPSVVFLDEPSAGMDPITRRGLWTAIEAVADNCSVVLTTHHLEEVEALAHRVAIMVDGTLRCIGDKTHLKQKFGTGFEVNVRVRDESCIESAKSYFTHTFPGSTLSEVQSTRLSYALTGSEKLSRVFTLLEEGKEGAGFIDYSVSQTSIEQVFLRISEEAELAQEKEERRKAEEEQHKECCSCMCC